MDNYTYWRKREEEARKKYIQAEKRYKKIINSYYDSMMDQIQKEINNFYSRYADKEGITMAEAKRRVSQLDMDAYERKAAKYVKEKNFSKQANYEMRLYNATMKINRLEMLKANIGLELVAGHDELQKFFEQTLTNRTLAEFERQAGILGATIQNNADKARSIVNASFKNATFSDRIWMHQDLLKAELSKLLQTGLIQGRSSNVLARELRKQFGVKKGDAERLMQTELARVQVDAQFQGMLENEYEEYEYIACGNSDVCDVCKELDGQHFKISEAEIGKNAPPMHPWCHCSVAAHINDKDYSEWLDGYKDHGMNFEEWKAKDVEKLGGNGIINNAKGSGSFQSFNAKALSSKTDISIDDIKSEMNNSPVGREVLKQISDSDAQINLLQGVRSPEGERGSQQGDIIKIYLDKIPNARVAAQTVIHEMTHYYYDIGGCQWAEAACFAREKMHIEGRNDLTFAELRYVVGLARKHYADLNWKRGGYKNGKNFRK